MTIDWNTKESYQRLLAAVHAASPQTHNYRLIATMFGQGATYDAIEGRFRKIKADAMVLKKEVESGERPEAPPRGAGSAKSTPRKKKADAAVGGDGVVGGRVTKAAKGGRGGGRGRKKETRPEPEPEPDSMTTEDSTEGVNESFVHSASMNGEEVYDEAEWEEG
ncbi:MAG: hypothetical protein M1816_000747 [Peltula sp. TS41687]|nr:MAG: hypothetical protein M1816_000747 [Peltula sp. TS41687]